LPSNENTLDRPVESSKLSGLVLLAKEKAFTSTNIVRAAVARIKKPQKIKKYFSRGLKFWRINVNVSFIISPKSRGFASSMFEFI
jgi:hypothetical protein